MKENKILPYFYSEKLRGATGGKVQTGIFSTIFSNERDDLPAPVEVQRLYYDNTFAYGIFNQVSTIMDIELGHESCLMSINSLWTDY